MKGLTSYADVIAILDRLPEMVKERRRQLGLSLRDAAKVSGVSFNALSRFERGGVTTSDTVRMLLCWMSGVNS